MSNFSVDECLVDDCIGFWENFRDWQNDTFEGIYYSKQGLPDPDIYGNSLYDFHEKLWNIQRHNYPNLYIPKLKNNSDCNYNSKKSIGGQYARVLSSTEKSIRLGSDSIINIYWQTKKKQYLMDKLRKDTKQFPYICIFHAIQHMNEDLKNRRMFDKDKFQSDWKKFIWLYLQRSNTIGGFILFPRHSMPTINTARGSNSNVQDRFDLTLECIKRYYENPKESQNKELYNPLFFVLDKDKEFFDMFGSFDQYTKFFCLDKSWVKNNQVLNLLDNESLDEYNFTANTLLTENNWWTFYENIMSRLDARNCQIGELLNKKMV